MGAPRIDIAVLGGGLAGGLIALAFARLRPELQVTLIEQGAQIGGNHVWSYFATDIAPQNAWLVEPLVAARWDGYEVRFPAHSRVLGTPYRSIVSQNLDREVRRALPAEALLMGVQVAAAAQREVVLADGRALAAGAVIDARGMLGLPTFTGGWQKFRGRMLRLDRPHGLPRPLVMDATVDQFDGYRFAYCLPFTATEIFIEDTYYSDGAELRTPPPGGRIEDYAAAHGWGAGEVLREETGVLPVIGAGDFAALWPDAESGPARAGVRAGLVHPLTSYTLPDAVRLAAHLAALPDVSGAALARASHAWAQAHWRKGGFYRMLTRMMFGAGEPRQRFRMLERFYRLPEPLIERFYAGRSTLADRVRILAGKPPVPLSGALATLAGRGRPLARLGHVPAGAAA
jgi:lycopene beta-cyclase